MPQPINTTQEKQLKKLGARIKAIRESKGLTQEQVGDAIGKDRQSIYKLESGRFNPSYIYLLEVCKGLQVKFEDLVKGL